MKRRSLLALTGSVVLAGCSSTSPGDSQSPESATDPTTRKESHGTTDSPATTKTDSPSPDGRFKYSFGEWHSTEYWNVVVRGLDLSTTFRVDEDETKYEMPQGEQLAIAPIDVENTTDIQRGWAVGMGFLTNEETVFESQMSFNHPKFENTIDIKELQQVEHQRQFQPSALPVDSGETARLWAVAVVLDSYSRQQFQVGMKHPPAGLRYPIRWEA